MRVAPHPSVWILLGTNRTPCFAYQVLFCVFPVIDPVVFSARAASDARAASSTVTPFPDTRCRIAEDT